MRKALLLCLAALLTAFPAFAATELDTSKIAPFMVLGPKGVDTPKMGVFMALQQTFATSKISTYMVLQGTPGTARSVKGGWW